MWEQVAPPYSQFSILIKKPCRNMAGFFVIGVLMDAILCLRKIASYVAFMSLDS